MKRQLRAWWLRVRGLRRSEARERELADEIDSHIQMQTEEFERVGMSPAEARRQALLKLGGRERTQQAYRERDTLPLVADFLQDLRYSLRQLARNRGFAITAVLVLTLGIAACVGIFAFADAAPLQPLPYRQPDRLVDVNESGANFRYSPLSYPDFVDWKRLNHVFQSLDAWEPTGWLLLDGHTAEPVRGARVTDGFFRTLGVTPILGRDFYPGEDLPSGPRTLILQYESWQRRFGGRSDVIGKVLSLGGVPYTIVGVLPKSFSFAPRGRGEFWTPFHAESECDLRRSCHSLSGVARLRENVTLLQAQSEMQNIASRLEAQYPGSNRGQGASLQSLAESFVGDYKSILLTLLAGAALLLLIACVNVSSLLLVRAESRRREMAVRGALGASRLRLVRQFLTEGLVLALVSSVLGFVAAQGFMHVLVQLIPQHMRNGMPYLDHLGLSIHVVLFTGTIALAATVLFAATPLVRLPTQELHGALADGSRGAAGTLWRRLGANLVVVELAIAMVLLSGAGLLGKSLYRLLHVDLGFQPDHLATMEVDTPSESAATETGAPRLDRTLVDRLNATPGVVSAALTSVLPVSFNGNTDWLRFVGKPWHGEHNESLEREITPNYFRTLGARLLSGRAFTDDDDATHRRVAIINRALAEKYFPGEDPIGRQVGNLDLAPDSLKTIVGVVDNFREGPLDKPIWPAIYYPIYQSSDSGGEVVARTNGSPEAMLPTLSDSLRRLHLNLGILDPDSMQSHIEDSPAAYLHRSAAWMVGGFALLAALLGSIGLYGVIAYSVSQRTREIGVRIALGAQRGSIYALVMKEAGRVAAFGVAAGLVASVIALSLMSSLLFRVSAWDIPTLLAVSALLAVAALAASFLPARRAAAVDPVEALRAE